MLSPLIGEYETLTGLGADIIGISADDVDTHWNFCKKLGQCPYPLASDVDLEVTRVYDALNDEGKRAKRAVYILDEAGIILHKIPWYQPGNVGQLMEIFSALGLEE